MNTKLENQLYEKYPLIFIQRLQPESISCMHFGLCIGDGWYNPIDKLCKKIQDYNNTNNTNVQAVQVKVKFNELRFYVDNADDNVYEFIQKTEWECYKTCEICGCTLDDDNRAIMRYRNICNNCKLKLEREYK